MDFAQFLRQSDSWKTFLVEVEPCHEVEPLTWTQHGTYTNLFSTPYTHGVVSRVTQDGVEYVEAYSLSECNGTAEMFYYDFDNQVLYLHTTDSDDPSTQTTPPAYDYVILAYFWRYFTNIQYEDSAVVFPRSVEVLVDGGLELWDTSTTLTEWGESVSGSSTVNRDQDDAYDGAFCVRLDIDGSNSLAYVNKTIRLKPGSSCKLTVYYKHSGSATSGIQLSDSTGTVWLNSSAQWTTSTLISLSNTTTWTKYEISFTAHTSYSEYIIYLVRNSAASASCFFDKASLIMEREDNPYLPYITTAGMPELHQAVSPFHETTMTMEFGQLQMVNDGWWWYQLDTYYWSKKDVIIRFGTKGSDYSDFQEVFHGLIRTPKINDLLVSIDVIDSKAFAYKDIPSTTFEVSTYANLEDGAEGTPIPIIYGEFEEVVPTCIDITTYKYKVAGHALEAIPNVWKNGVLLTVTTDYTLDLANGEFTLLADPGEAFVTCGVKGRKCAILDGTYSENVADILYDILKTYAEIDPVKIDLKSFLDLQSARSQNHHLYLNTAQSALEVARVLQQSALFHLVPLLNGNLGAFRYTEGTTSDTPIISSDEIDSFGIEYDTEAVYQKIKFNYALLPSENHYLSVERSSDAPKWKHGVGETHEITTSLRLKTDAEDLADFYINILKDPLRKVTGVLPPRMFTSYPGSKVIITRTRPLADGTIYEVLSSAPMRILDLKKRMSSGKVEVVAWDDLQSSGGVFCENCYHCETCVTAQSGTCSSCFTCQLCVSGQCSSCQTCYYCQQCNSGQCTSCMSCDTCESCYTCQGSQCSSCVSCQKCNTGQCTACEECVSCQHCYECQKCYGGLLP